MEKTIRALLQQLYLLWRDPKGAVAAIMAIVLVTLIGFGALGIETGLWFTEKRHLQSAADSAALSGAFLLAAADPNAMIEGFASGSICYTTGGCLTGIQSVGTTMAARNGFTAATTPPGAITITQGYWSGSAYTANGTPLNAVQAVITQQKNTLLAAVYRPSVTIGVSAVAEVINNFAGGACILALDQNAGDAKDVNFSGTAVVNMPNCVVAANSTNPCAINLGGTPNVSVSDIYTAGAYCTNGNSLTLSTQGIVPVTSAAIVTDPFASMFPANPNMPVSCSGATSLPSNTTTFSPGIYTGAQLTGSSTYTFSPGTYYFCGNFTASATINTASGGANFIISGAISVTGSGNLSAPQSGPYPGILFYQPGDATDQTNDKINGGANLLLTGAIYLPGGNLTFNGNSTGSPACLEIAAYTVTFTGTTSLTNAGCPADNTQNINITNIVLAQ